MGVAPVAYLIGLVTAAILAEFAGLATVDVVATIQVGWPGIVVLAVLGLLADRLLRGTTP